MKRLTKYLFVLSVFFTVLAFVGMAAAHDLYLMPESFRVDDSKSFTVAIHNGDGFPDSQSAPPLQRLRDATLHTARGTSPLQDLRVDGKRALALADPPSPAHVLVTIVSEARTDDMKGAEFVKYLEEEGLTGAIASLRSKGESDKTARERYTKYAKTIVVVGAGDGGFARPAGLPIEFIPESDPFHTKVGSSLPVKLLFRGKPAADILVTAASTGNPKPHPIGRTDATGRVMVPIEAAGKFRLHAIQMERCAEPSAAEWESFWATLTFEVR